MWRPSCAAIDASDAVIANLSRAQHQQETPGAQYPYLLKGLAINRPNQVWRADITYIRMERWFLYLVAIMDWYIRKVLAWRLSNTLETDFCVAALKEALAKYGPPEIFNTDQGSQFTSSDWIDELKVAKVTISMDGKGRWIDNRMVERLCRSLKYECVYLRAFETGREARWCAVFKPTMIRAVDLKQLAIAVPAQARLMELAALFAGQPKAILNHPLAHRLARHCEPVMLGQHLSRKRRPEVRILFFDDAPGIVACSRVDLIVWRTPTRLVPER